MELTKLKEQLCEVCHMMWQQGWTAANDGNVSARAGDGVFLATPTGVSKGAMLPEMLVLVGADGKMLEENACGYRPSSELKMHMRCYEQREDVAAVVHAHPPTATAFACAERALDDYSLTEGVVSLGCVPLAPYATPSTNEVPDSITPLLASHDAVLLAHHGALTVGPDLMSAYYHMETVELWAKISLNARLLGGAVELPREKLDTLFYLRDNYYHLPGRHPGYEKEKERGGEK